MEPPEDRQAGMKELMSAMALAPQLFQCVRDCLGWRFSGHSFQDTVPMFIQCVPLEFLYTQQTSTYSEFEFALVSTLPVTFRYLCATHDQVIMLPHL